MPMAIKIVLVENVLAETVLAGDPPVPCIWIQNGFGPIVG